MKRPLAGKIAVVAGATRGAGRGIATALGEAGATVYCTGRSVAGRPGMANRPETIDETAARVTERGGRGIAVRVDHTVPSEVAALFERVGDFDILVNDIWGGDDLVVTPGFLRSEWMLDHFGVTESNWRDAAEKVKPFIASETPLFVGRCVAALAADPNVFAKNGRVFASWDLGEEYAVNDADGTRPHFLRWLQANQPEVASGWKKLDEVFYAYWGAMPYDMPG